MRALFLAFILACVCFNGRARAAETITFDNGCVQGQRIVVAAVGDLLFHRLLQRQALTPTGRYSDFWQPVEQVIRQADLSYGNLEGPAAESLAAGGREITDPGRRLDGRAYDSVLRTLNFNYHPSVVKDLKAAGFSVISTANNHAYDRGPLGVDRTVQAFEREGLPHIGTRRRDSKSDTWGVVTEAKGVKVAWLACTWGLNGMRDPERQVLHCYRDKPTVLSEIKRYYDDPTIDAVILTPHWGVENSATPLASDRRFAREAIMAGASAVIGAHPHVLQPWEKVKLDDGREGIVMYSNGNFVSNQRRPQQRAGVISLVELTKPAEGKARVSAVGYIPTWVEITNIHRVVEMRQGGPFGVPKVLPPGNRVTAKNFQNLPKHCPAQVSGNGGAAADNH
jgi:poly-gamma-glutamate capsule biosynthesis protein CapA/YwtB (metallophosphatase superfamily)